MTPTERVPCPICGSTLATQVRFSSDIVTCHDCGTTYLRTRPSIKALEDFYQFYASNPGSHMRLPDTMQQVKSSGLRRDYFLKEVMEFVRPPGKMLDVGSGWGAFLDNARDHGFQVCGYEICKQMADFASVTLNIPTATTQFQDAQFSPGAFDVVTAIHSFEHLPNQSAALDLIHKILVPGGFFCGIVPNFGSYMSEKQGEKWPWLDGNWHYVHMTPETLRKNLPLFGFEPVRIYTATDDFDRSVLPNGDELEKLEKEGRGEAIRFFARKAR